LIFNGFCIVEKTEFDMKCAVFFVALSVVMSVAIQSESFAQTSSMDTGPVTGIKPDRTIAPRAVREAMQRREAVIRKKQATVAPRPKPKKSRC
jgi:hypothetical protein